MIARAAAAAATCAVLTASPAEAQSSTMRITIAGGPHAGTYEYQRGQCDALDGQVISEFTPELSGVTPGPKVPEAMEVYTEPGRGGADGVSVRVHFRTPSRQRVVYEIYAIPAALQAPGMEKPQKGRGTVTVQQSASGTTATFRGQTADGVRMDGRVTCVAQR